MSLHFIQVVMFFIVLFTTFAYSYSGSHAYNKMSLEKVSVNAATGTFDFAYPIIAFQGIRKPFELNLIYRFNHKGLFGLPEGWQLDLDYIDGQTANIHGQQWLIDPLWRDETLTASGLKYYNQHGSKFIDKIEVKPIPGFKEKTFRFVLQHKDGSLSYFSHQGLLVLKVDRFDNAIVFNYQQPVRSLQSARLDTVIDDYGNKYQFIYAPNEMRVMMPDKREMIIYSDNDGIMKIVDPLTLHTNITYVQQFNRHLIKSIESPSGLFVNLTYSSIHVNNDGKTQIQPVVDSLEKIDRACNKILEQTHYKYSTDNNFTGFPNYSLSGKTDNLMDSGDQSYRYWVQITKSDLGTPPKFHSQLFYYNYLHLPVEVTTLKEGNPYLKTAYTYNISPFKYSRSTNYDKPHTIIKSLWSDAHHRFVDTERNTNNYDRYGNKIFECHEVFDRLNNKWNKISNQSYSYFPDYSLNKNTMKTDFVTGQKIQHHYTLSPDKKTHQSVEISYAEGEKSDHWLPWQKQSFQFDSQGRKTYHDRQWQIDEYPGVEKTWQTFAYNFDSVTRQLTKARIKASGAVMQSVIDTRNNQKIKHITPLNEIWTCRYDALNQLTEINNPLGCSTNYRYLTYQQEGLNAVVTTSPLGFKQRTIFNAKHQSIEKQDYYNDEWRHLSSSRYNGFGKVIDTKDINELTSTTDYDEFERPLMHVDVYGNKTEYQYDDYLLTTTSYLNNHKVQVKQSEPWNLLVRDRVYPNNENLLDPQSETVENTVKYSGFKKKIEETNSLVDRYHSEERESVSRFFRYDANLNVREEKTCGFGDTELSINYTHDIFNHRVTKQKNLRNASRISSSQGETLVYDVDGLLAQIQSAKLDSDEQRVTRFIYNKNGKKTRTVLPGDQVISQTYNALSLPEKTRWMRAGKPYQISNQYDADRRLISTKDSESQSFSFSYLANGLLTQMVYPDGQSIAITYDDKNRKIKEKTLAGPLHYFHYDSKDLGKLSSISFDDLKVTYHYGLDDNGYHHQLIHRSFDQPVTGETLETFTYGSLGLPVKTEVLNRKEGVVYEVDYTFNPRKQLVALSMHSHKGHSTAESAQMRYSYNALNELISEQVTKDGASRELHYQYDANGNLTLEKERIDGKYSQKTFVYNPLDQLVQISSDYAADNGTLSYDVDGRLIKDHKGHDYIYDDKGYLLSVKTPNKKIRYDYWLNGLLASRKLADASREDASTQLYQGHDKNIIAINDSGQWQYLLRDNKGILASRKGKGDATGHERVKDEWFMMNHSVGALLTDTGQLLSQQYMAYGSPLKAALPKAAGLLGWHQEYADHETELVYLQSRFYSPVLKRFITPDNRLVDNRYRYAKSNPLFYYDPTGHNARALNYGLGSGITALGVLGVVLAAPTGGASLTLSGGAAVTAGVSTAMSGAALMGSQVAIDSGNKQAAKALQYTSVGLGMAALALAGISIAPAIQTYFSVGWFDLTGHWYDTTNLWEAAAAARTSANARGFRFIELSHSESVTGGVIHVPSSISSSSNAAVGLGPTLSKTVEVVDLGQRLHESGSVLSSTSSSWHASTASLSASSTSQDSWQPLRGIEEVLGNVGAVAGDLDQGAEPVVLAAHPTRVLNPFEVEDFLWGGSLYAPVEELSDDVFADEARAHEYLFR